MTLADGMKSELFVELKPDMIDAVELVGGSTRMSMVRQLVQTVFGKEPSTTLNQDEAVAKGCGLQVCTFARKSDRIY